MSETNGYASRESLLGGYKVRYRDVPVPSGEKVRIRNLPAGVRDEYVIYGHDPKTGLKKPSALKTAAARLIQLCVVDGQGNRLFSKEDIPLLQDSDPEWQDAVYAEAAKFCNLIADEGDEEKND